jgi:hypothetical protein
MQTFPAADFQKNMWIQIISNIEIPEFTSPRPINLNTEQKEKIGADKVFINSPMS